MRVLRTAASLAAAALPLAAGSAWCPPLDARCCHISDKDPAYHEFHDSAEHRVPGWEEVDLDAPAAERWAHLVKPKAQAIQAMIDSVKAFLGRLSKDVLQLMEDLPAFQRMSTEVLDAMGEYGEEIRGIAKATGIREEELLVYNLFYEIEGGCTSILAQDQQGHLVHGRNLDFGLFFGLDVKEMQWTLTEMLRPLLVQIRFKQGGSVAYNATVFLGYVGLHTGAKHGGFSLSINSRYDGERWRPLLDYLRGRDRTGQALTLLARDVMLRQATYDDALEVIQRSKILGPAYVILGGTRPGQGTVVARNATHVLQQEALEEAQAAGQQFVVQTNWDRPKDPWFDNRRSPAERCLADRYRERLDFEGMFRVLSAHPNRNRLTTFTALMSAQTGEFEAYLQNCKEASCALWVTATTSTTGQTLVV